MYRHWDEFWHKKPYEGILTNPPEILYGGTSDEPLASMNMTCFLDPVKDQLVEGVHILDYGCGAGILLNILSERLKNFEYYGVEVDTSYGIGRIALANAYFKDSRASFGTIGNDFPRFLRKDIDVVILISVFTHLLTEDTYVTLDKFFEDTRSKSVVFSCFTDTYRHAETPQPDVWERFYFRSYILDEDIKEYARSRNLQLSHWGSFLAQGVNKHEVYVLRS